MMIARDTLLGAEEAIYGHSNLYRIFQAKGSLFDGTLERPQWRRRSNTLYYNVETLRQKYRGI
jgi:hypothetical protein